jgi:hypothetical protein
MINPHSPVERFACPMTGPHTANGLSRLSVLVGKILPFPSIKQTSVVLSRLHKRFEIQAESFAKLLRWFRFPASLVGVIVTIFGLIRWFSRSEYLHQRNDVGNIVRTTHGFSFNVPGQPSKEFCQVGGRLQWSEIVARVPMGHATTPFAAATAIVRRRFRADFDSVGQSWLSVASCSSWGA